MDAGDPALRPAVKSNCCGQYPQQFAMSTRERVSSRKRGPEMRHHFRPEFLNCVDVRRNFVKMREPFERF